MESATLHGALSGERGSILDHMSVFLEEISVNIKAFFPLLSCAPAKNSDYNGNNENLKQCLIKSA